MSKIDEILKLQKEGQSIQSTIIDKIDLLSTSTEKYIFSVSMEKGFAAIIRNKKLDVSLSLDIDETKVLYKFLQNIFAEAPQDLSQDQDLDKKKSKYIIKEK